MEAVDLCRKFHQSYSCKLTFCFILMCFLVRHCHSRESGKEAIQRNESDQIEDIEEMQFKHLKGVSHLVNFRPRFNIPRGELSYFRTPNWEILYYLKHGVIPSKSQWLIARAEFLEKIRKIRNFQEQAKKLASYESNSPRNMKAVPKNTAFWLQSKASESIESIPSYISMNTPKASVKKVYPKIITKKSSRMTLPVRISSRRSKYMKSLRSIGGNSVKGSGEHMDLSGENFRGMDPVQSSKKFQTQGWK